MSGRTPKLSISEVEALRRKGYTQKEIADMQGVTQQYVSWIKMTYGGHRTPRERALDHFPWKVPNRFTTASTYRRMRDHAEFAVTGGVGMRPTDLRRLRTFYRRLIDDDLVVEFDPDIPPKKGFAKCGGWALRDRKPGDGDLMIRVNEYTKITDEGRLLWRIPQTLP